MTRFRLCTLFSAIVALAASQSQTLKWNQKKVHHEPATLTNEQLRIVSSLSDPKLFNDTLDNILIPRVPGTHGHKQVQKFIIDTMKALNWEVTLDTFSDQTPLGTVEFTNIVATLDPKADRHLVLACHYDSKLNREKTLVVATDSAVPCTMMINIAQVLAGPLKHRTELSDVTLRLLFLDGEEAFVQWSDTDSLYGARHLASEMYKQSYPPNNVEGTSHLDRMDVFVLLDLLGAKDPKFPSYFYDTNKLFLEMKSLEDRLHSLGLLLNHNSNYFQNFLAYGGVEDDHVPFLQKGVRILHLIPSPFPSVWHMESDNLSNLDFPTIENLNRIFRAFVVEYLHMKLESPL
jgi:glutaminyl-peptide cyclotransferase